MNVSAKTLLWTAGALASSCLTGCGGSSSSGTNLPIVTPRSVAATLSNGLTATLTEDRTTVSVGGTVTYTVTLANSTAQPVTYQPVYGPGSVPSVPATLTVTDPSGAVVYPVGPFPQLVAIGPSVTLAPGQSVSETQAVSTIPVAGLAVAEGYSRAGQYAATVTFGFVPSASGNTQAAPPVGPLIVTAN